MPRLVLALLLAAFPAVAAEPAPGAGRVFEFSLAPGKLEEECLRMEAGAKRSYRWKSDAPVDFNIHHHRGKDVFYPVKRTAVRGHDGTFAAKSADDYCWMWTARDKPAKVEGRIEGK